MKPIENFDQIKTISEAEKLPAGGYIVDIMGAEEVTYSWGSVLEIRFDIAEGEYKDYFVNQYTNTQLENKKYKGTYRMNIPKDDGSDKDEWTGRKFKSDIIAIEESNPSFRWDWNEKLLAGKKVGAIFFEKEYDFEGKQGFFTTVHSLKPVDAIKNGKFKIPNPKLLGEKKPSPVKLYEINVGDDELPFKV